MKIISRFIFCALGFTCLAGKAQNISGIINSYAAVTSISGSSISVSSATAFAGIDRILLIQMKGASVDLTNTTAFGDILSMGGAGNYEFLDVSASTPSLLVVSSALAHAYNVDSGFVQVVSVPRYCTPVVSASLSCLPWDMTTGTGGILTFEAGTLTLNARVDVSGKGFAGGTYGSGTFACDNGNFFGVQGDDGGQKGESISDYVDFHDGYKGKQANGGGGSNSGNSGGGGGANGGAGGLGGHQYSGCGSYDDRGIGGLSLSASASKLFMGGGGGGGYQDNGQTASNGGNGGGIIYIKANAIVSNNVIMACNGESVTAITDAEGAGGGGAGGSIFIECANITGSLTVQAHGGTGGSNNNSIFVTDCHGTGGGGGGGIFAFSSTALPASVSYSALGGAAGLVNNSSSTCYNTSNGATDGAAGVSVSALPSSYVMNVPVLTISPVVTVCPGQTTSLSISGAATYSWSTGSTATVIAVSPTQSSSYSVTGKGSGISCKTSASTSVMVSDCTVLNEIDASGVLVRLYPNPVNNFVDLESNRSFNLVIYDGLGKTVREFSAGAGHSRMDIQDLPAGTYLVSVNTTSGVKYGKLVKVWQ